MPRITLYLDDQTEKLMRERAAAARMPFSRWVAHLIRAQAGSSWSLQVTRLLGAFPDMPLVEDLRALDVPDLPREPW